MTLSERIRDTAKAAGMYGTVMDDWADQVKQLEQENEALFEYLMVLLPPVNVHATFPPEPG